MKNQNMLYKLNRWIGWREVKCKTVEKQKIYIENLGKPRDLLEASYFQYKCQNFHKKKIQIAVANIMAFVAWPWFYFKFTKHRKRDIEPAESYNAVCTMDFIRDLLPESLLIEYKKIGVNVKSYGRLNAEEKKFIIKMVSRYPFSMYFTLKIMYKIAIYSDIINSYSVRAIFSSAEYSFTSSYLTEYCRNKGVEHINIMHGEKVFDIVDSFCTFDRHYVWEEYYVNLFSKLKVGTPRFIVEVPKTKDFFPKNTFSNDVILKYDYKYYMGEPSTKDLKNISRVVMQLQKQNCKICVRIHPVYGDLNKTKRYIPKELIEMPQNINISESIEETKGVISEFSTVLYQAYRYGKDIIIDDITDKEGFLKQRDLEYFMLTKPHQLLSEIVGVIR